MENFDRKVMAMFDADGVRNVILIPSTNALYIRAEQQHKDVC
jgi:hypothetical protein